MMKLTTLLFTLCLASFPGFAQRPPEPQRPSDPQRASDDSRQLSEPKLFFKKDNREVTERTGARVTRKLFDPNDKAKSIDFSIENIGNTQGLVVVSESLDEKYNNWKVVVKNKGVKKSDNSIYVLMVSQCTVKKKTYPNPLPGNTTTCEVTYQDHKILPKLDPGEEMTTWFGLAKSGMPNQKTPFASLFSNIGNTKTYYKISSYFVTDMIFGK